MGMISGILMEEPLSLYGQMLLGLEIIIHAMRTRNNGGLKKKTICVIAS